MQPRASLSSRIQRTCEALVFGLFAMIWTSSFTGCQSITSPPSDNVIVKYGGPEPRDTLVVRYGT
ncbi:MAG TPA: hypothetical protein PKY05_19730, partial [Fibrobacteria bacterium]|nr:hypothetical protein [Fibrobacteria bacterium]